MWIHFGQPNTLGPGGPCFGEDRDLAVTSNAVGCLASCLNLEPWKLQEVQTHGVFIHVAFDILPVKHKAQ